MVFYNGMKLSEYFQDLYIKIKSLILFNFLLIILKLKTFIIINLNLTVRIKHIY